MLDCARDAPTIPFLETTARPNRAQCLAQRERPRATRLDAPRELVIGLGAKRLDEPRELVIGPRARRLDAPWELVIGLGARSLDAPRELIVGLGARRLDAPWEPVIGPRARRLDAPWELVIGGQRVSARGTVTQRRVTTIGAARWRLTFESGAHPKAS